MLIPHRVGPQEIKAILQALAEADTVLIGGQAINVWSCIYERSDCEPWRSSRPYTSVDADVLADRAEMVKLARLLERKGFEITVQFPRTESEVAVNTRLITVRTAAQELDINLVQTPIGVSSQDIRTNAVALEWEGVTLRLVHPLICVESKAHNLIQLEQDAPGVPRQDKKHLVLAIANLREHLHRRSAAEYAMQSLTIAKRLVDFAYHQTGRDVLVQAQIDVLDGIPWPEWNQHVLAELRDFATRELEFRTEIRERIAADEEVARWLKELKNK